MKLTINRDRLNESLNRVSKALPVTSPLPSLEGILISVSESIITLLASNGTLSIKEEINTQVDLKILVPGTILVPGKLFKEIINKQKGEINIYKEDNKVFINSEGFNTNINLLNKNDFPIISFDSIGKEIILDSSEFKNAIKNVSFAAAENDNRIILNGVNLKSKKGMLVATATNSYRLAQQKCKLSSNSEFDATILSKNLKDFLPDNAKGEITILVDDAKIVTKYYKTITSSKLIDSIYPDVEKLIPYEFENEIKIEVKELLSLIDKVTIMSDDAKKIIKLNVNDKELKLTSRKKEIGNSEVITTNFDYDGEEFEIVFNGQFLKDAISKFNNVIKVSFNSNQKPFIIRSIEDDSITQLILPHRVF